MNISLDLYLLDGVKAPIKTAMVELGTLSLKKKTQARRMGTAAFTVKENLDLTQDFFTKVNNAPHIIRLVDPPILHKWPATFFDQSFFCLTTKEHIETENVAAPRFYFSHGKWAPVYFSKINLRCANALNDLTVASANRSGVLHNVKTPVGFDFTHDLIIKIAKVNYEFHATQYTDPHTCNNYSVYDEMHFYAIKSNNYTFCKVGRKQRTAPNFTGQRYMHF